MENVISLDNLFHKRIFLVPDYQRGYSWEKRHVQEFLEDLEILRENKFHYTGTIVLHKIPSTSNLSDSEGGSYSRFAIVDGQQRLTTIVILLNEICQFLQRYSDSAKTLSQGIKKVYVSAMEPNSGPLYKLKLNNDTDHYFRHAILAEKPAVEGASISSEKRLQLVKDEISKYLISNIEKHDQQSELWLTKLYQKLSTQLRFTLYQVENEAEVGVIFEVMNDRGKPLTDLEKVKNFLLHMSTRLDTDNNHLTETVNEAWSQILRQLMLSGLESSSNEDRLLRMHWIAYYNYQSRHWQGSRSVKEYFDLRKFEDDHAELLRMLNSYVEGLRESCISFCDIYKPNRSGSFQSYQVNQKSRRNIIALSEKLNRINVLEPFIPLLIASRKKWANSPEEYQKIVCFCEKYSFRVFRLNGSRSNAGQGTLFWLAYCIANEGYGIDSVIKSLTKELSHRSNSEMYLMSLSPDSRSNSPEGWYKWRGLRYFLYEYEESLANKNGANPKIDWAQIRETELEDSIEHILPVTIEGQEYWEQRFDSSNHEKYLHDLGNLTLTKHNSHYKNKDFVRKKGSVNSEGHCYSKSPLFVERELERWDEWTVESITERKNVMLNWAKDRWSVDLTNVEPSDSIVEDSVIEDDEF